MAQAPVRIEVPSGAASPVAKPKRATSWLSPFTRGEVHLHLALTSLFVLLLVASSVATLAYTYVETSDAALHAAWQMMKTTNGGIYKDVLRYLGMAKRTTTAVSVSLRDARTIHDDQATILPLLLGEVRAQNEIFAISVGDRTGSVVMAGKIFDDPKYSVDRSKKLPPEVKYRIHLVDLVSEPHVETYRYLNADLKVIDQETVAADAIKYDARTKPWYELAAKKKANAWSDVTIYSNGQFGTSNAEPIPGPDGAPQLIVSSTIALSLREGITARLNVAQHGMAFVVDEEGRLIIHPDRAKITRCDEAGTCRFNKVDEIGDGVLATAFERYKKKSNLHDPANTPAKLNYQDYSAAVLKLEPHLRAAFDQLYSVDAKKETILVHEKVPDGARAALPEVLAALGYSYNMRFASGGAEYLASFHGFPGHYGKPWTVGTIVPVDDFIGPLKKTIGQVALISVAILAVAIVFIVFAARRILRPLALISRDMSRIQHLDIDETVKHASFFYEIDMIGSSLGAMKNGLKAFSKFVPVTLVKQLIASGKGAELGGEKRRLTIMFSDIEGFTTISESMPTEALLPHISEYLDNLTTIILDHGGTVDKYIGDAIMCFWGAPSPVPEQEEKACRTALLCTARLRALNAGWEKDGKPPLRTRFGINSGEVSVGNMGSSERMNYTVLGDAANVASRLEAINKYYGTGIIVGEQTHDVVKGRFVSRPIDVVAVKGKARGVRIYELLAGLPDDAELPPSADDLRRQELTERAFTAYLAREFAEAASLYRELADEFPDDALGEMFVARCDAYLKSPPDADWGGVMHMTEK
jgi:class 3 adenylate cyclase